MALTLLCSVFTAHIFTVKYNVLLGLFKFGLGLNLKVLASTSSVWPQSQEFGLV